MRNNFPGTIRSFHLSLLLLFGCIITCSPLHGQTVLFTLKNGDRITGGIVSETTNQVVISTPWMKELALPVSEISYRMVIAPAPAPVTETVKAEAPAAPPKAEAVEVKAKEKPKIAQKKSWSGKIDVGADLGFSENSWQLYYGRAKIIYAPQTPPEQIKKISDRFKNTFDYQATYGRTEGVLSANRMDGTSKTDFDIGKKVFVYNLVGGGYDEIRRITLQYEIGPGVGYHFLARSNLVLNAELGMNYQVQNLERTVAGVIQDETSSRFSLRLAQDFTWSLSKKLTFDEKLEFYPSLESLGDFRLRFETNLRYALWESGSGQNIYLALTLLDLYDTQPAQGVSKNDLQIRSSIGINF